MTDSDQPGALPDTPSIRRLLELDLPAGDWALFGSGPLLLRGWIETTGDLDVITRGAAWAAAVAAGTVSVLPDGNEIVDLGAGVTAGRSWMYGDVDIDELIDTAEPIAGIPCVGLAHVITYKRAANRPKDRAHLDVIELHTA